MGWPDDSPALGRARIDGEGLTVDVCSSDRGEPSVTRLHSTPCLVHAVQGRFSSHWKVSLNRQLVLWRSAD